MCNKVFISLKENQNCMTLDKCIYWLLITLALKYLTM